MRIELRHHSHLARRPGQGAARDIGPEKGNWNSPPDELVEVQLRRLEREYLNPEALGKTIDGLVLGKMLPDRLSHPDGPRRR